MITGSASIEDLAASAPTIKTWLPDAVFLPSVTCLQLTAEMTNQARESVLPPSLHPTVPPTVSIQAMDIAESPWGAFSLVVNRVSCRSGVRARGYTTQAFVSNNDAATGLAETFGFPTQVAEIVFRHGYDGADLQVIVEGVECLDLSAIDPEPMGLNDVQYTSTLNLAHTPNGLRLVQVEAHHEAEKVDRLSAWLNYYDGYAMGNELLNPYHVVSASLSKEQVEFPAVRFVCKVDELAFTGTEPIRT
jgi:hypothetical protein